jgi:hypothetical protein
MPQPPGVMAAPNKVRFKARVIGLEKDSQFSDKWYIDVEILNSESIEGPNFAREGERAKAFAFDVTPGFLPQKAETGNIIVVEAEYVGDGMHGTFRIMRMDS